MLFPCVERESSAERSGWSKKRGMEREGGTAEEGCISSKQSPANQGVVAVEAGRRYPSKKGRESLASEAGGAGAEATRAADSLAAPSYSKRFLASASETVKYASCLLVAGSDGLQCLERRAEPSSRRTLRTVEASQRRSSSRLWKPNYACVRGIFLWLCLWGLFRLVCPWWVS